MNVRSRQPTPVIAIVGRPNVGKSTLFNRLTRSRDALVANIPGLTRDRHYGRAESQGRRYVLIDTGGLEPVATDGVEAQMARQARQAILEADLVVFVTDTREGMTGRDLEIATELRRTARRLRVVVNKAEGMNGAIAVAEFHALGLGEPVPISAAHGENVADFMSDCLDELGVAYPDDEGVDDDAAAAVDEGAAEGVDDSATAGDGESAGRVNVERDGDRGTGGEAPDGASRAAGMPALSRQALAREAANRPIRVAVVGRPNSGKSTLINALLGEERLIAFDQPGTTRDAIEVDFEWQGRAFTMIDTAGLRRRAKVSGTIEKFSVVKTLQAIEDAHVCVLMIDASDGISEQDASISSFVLESGRAVVIGLNKWDAVARDDRDWVKREFSRKLEFLNFARMHPISARHGRGLDQLMKSVIEAHHCAFAKLSTPRLTRLLQAAVEHHQPPRSGPVRPKMRYAHQGGQNPPIVVIHGNALSKVTEAYRRYLEGFFRERLEIHGTRLRIEMRTGRNPYAD